MPASYTVPQTARDFLVEHGLASPNEDPAWTPLTGGVSSELWRVDLNQGAVCVKGALEELKVAGDWRAPVSRNAVEWEWLQFASSVISGHVPVPLAHDQQRGLFAMSYLPVEQHPVWKSQLLSGDIQVEEAATVGDLIGRLHSASAGDPELADRFATGENFHTLRIDPYLLATARRHHDLTPQFDEIIERTTSTHFAVVHGDVSPKNVLLGPKGPVLIDAECAWYGDPAFDLAFVINHLVIKTLVLPDQASLLLESARSLTASYTNHVTWEPDSEVLERTAKLLPALMLARVDGLSPVEYLNTQQQNVLRRAARQLLSAAEPELDTVLVNACRTLAPGTSAAG